MKSVYSVLTCRVYDYVCAENERRLDEELHDIKHVKDELREKRQRCTDLEVSQCKHLSTTPSQQ